jgi:cytochrome c-type biogenesis protein CcmH/NrfG
MDVTREQPKLWSHSQAYVLAVVCLLMGTVVGYLLHAPAPPTGSAAEAVQTRAPTLAPMANQVRPDQLKHMADKKAEPLLTELQKDPNDASLLAKIGGVYMAAQQYPAAKDYYERSLAIKADAAVMSPLSYVYYSQGDVDKAIAILNRALRIDPKNANALVNLGMLEWHAKSDPKAAIAAWETFLKTNPNSPSRAQVEKLIAKAKLHLNIPPGMKTDKPAM